jgi:ABC-2 type transport system permease protein
MARMHDVVSFEVIRTLRKKSFWYASIVPPIIILAILGISHFSKTSSDTTAQQQAQNIFKSAKIGVLDESGLILKPALVKEHVVIETSEQAGIDAVKSGKLDAFLYYPKDLTASGIQIYEQDKGATNTLPYDTVATALLRQDVLFSASKSIKNTQVVTLLQRDPSVTTTTYKNGVETHSLANLIAPGIMLGAFFTLIVLLASLMISSTTEEKENRVAEILLTSIKGRTLILGKILSLFILGLVQIATIVVPLLIVYEKFKSQISLPGGVSLSQIPLNPQQMTIAVVFFVLGLVMFTGLLVGLGAMFPSASDANRFLGVAIIWVFVPIYLVQYILTSPDALIVKVFTYFPLTAPTTALLLNTVGSLTIQAALPAVAILIVSATLAIMFAVRAFQYGAMEYGRRIGLKELFR